MPDDKKILRPHDAKRININEPYEVEYWTKKLNISKAELEAIIALVGDSVESVSNYINNKRSYKIRD